MDVTNTPPSGTSVEQRLSALLSPQPQAEPSLLGTATSDPEETSQPEVTPDVQTFKVKVDGADLDVPLDELLKGYSRTSDYTRKTQKVSEERKALEAETSAVKKEREQYTNALKVLESQLSTEEQVDWARLEIEDPIQYATKKLKDRDRKDQLALVQQEQQRIAYLRAEEERKALLTHIQAEQAKLADAIPEWKDAKVAKTEKEKLSSYLADLGYSEADISQIYDHRAVQTIRKAWLYDEMMSKAKTQTEKVGNSPKTARPGNLQPQTSKEYAQAREQLRKTGKTVDAIAALNHILRVK
jgi:DNA repair exonuclease SbcCD ATPase subunit